MKRRCLVFICTMLFSVMSSASEPDKATTQEIEHLLAYISESHCLFNRNGDWYQPQEAVEHIIRKYQYIVGRGLVKSTEDFIKYAATESSFSGRAYKIRCGDDAERSSAQWLHDELVRYRQSYQ